MTPMNETLPVPCTYHGNRDQAMVAYLYEDITPFERAQFEAHLVTCEPCRVELAGFRGVRTQLDRWDAPDPVAFAHTNMRSVTRYGRALQAMRAVPVWAQMAAAFLLLGVSAGLANLDVHYDQSGLTVRTGWARPAPVNPVKSVENAQNVQNGVAPVAVTPASAPWRSDLAALEQQLRAEMRAQGTMTAASAPVARVAAPADADAFKRVRALVDESERRQQRELALRIAQVMNDLGRQRQADLYKIDRSLGAIQQNTGVEVIRQGRMLDYLAQRVSQTGAAQTKP